MLYEINTFPEEEKGFPMHELQEEPTIHPSCKIKNSKIGSWTSIGANTTFQEVIFDDYSYTAGNVNAAYSTIGKFCSIANSARINPGNHPQWRVTQHHCTYRKIRYDFDTVDDNEFFQWRRNHYCNIGHDTWIGHGAIIMPGVNIGIGAVIGSGAVVTKDVGDYEVAVGVPAKVIKRRFPLHIAEKLMEIAWWNWDRKTLETRFSDLMEVESFIEKYGNDH